MKQQQEQMAAVENEQKTLLQFEAEWNQRISEKEQENARVMAEFQDKQSQELEEFRRVNEQKTPNIFKASAELLNLRSI